ncbi:MAG: DUF4261 domain-containing protein [Actinomycetota bacterium]|nr:DUF4261 domain-containing protein [Actinomycetota bacterium]
MFWFLDPAVGYMSCGMHNLGLPDVVVPSVLDPVEGLDLVRCFLYFQLVDRPRLHDGETFAAAEGEPIYRLRHVPPPADENEWDELFTNEHGVWHLELA